MVSDVPLTEDILGEKPPFTFSYYEWLSIRGVQTIIRLTTASATFNVPEGHVLFVTYAGIDADILTNAQTTLVLSSEEDDIISMHASNTGAPGNHFDKEMNLSIPIQISSLLRFTSPAAFNGECNIIGFLVKKTDLTFL